MCFDSIWYVIKYLNIAKKSITKNEYCSNWMLAYRATVSGSKIWGKRPSTIIKLWPPFVIFWNFSMASGSVCDRNVSISNRLQASCNMSHTTSFLGNTNSTCTQVNSRIHFVAIVVSWGQLSASESHQQHSSIIFIFTCSVSICTSTACVCALEIFPCPICTNAAIIINLVV